MCLGHLNTDRWVCVKVSSLSAYGATSNRELEHKADGCEPRRQVGHGRIQAVQWKGGTGVLGTLGALSSKLHLTSELQDTATVVIRTQQNCSDRRRFVFDLTLWLRYPSSIFKGFRRFAHQV